MSEETITVEVAYATADSQKIVPIKIEQGATIKDAIILSGIFELFPEIDLAENDVGIFSKTAKLEDQPVAGDRIEIYRPLIADPKQARKKRAEKDKKGKQAEKVD